MCVCIPYIQINITTFLTAALHLTQLFLDIDTIQSINIASFNNSPAIFLFPKHLVLVLLIQCPQFMIRTKGNKITF